MTPPPPSAARAVLPDASLHAAFLAAVDEFRAEGRGAAGDVSVLGDMVRGHHPAWRSPGGFAAFLERVRAEADPDAPRPSGRVPSTELWWVADGEVLGTARVRHRLTEGLRASGGHIGYDVRPSARGLGHGTALLAAALRHAAGLGIGEALLTCAPGNTGSRRVIEANGGVPAGHDATTLRFLVPTATASLSGG